MNSLYAFLFCFGLGIAARPLYMLVSLLAKKTDLIPVTVVLDTAFTMLIGTALIVYIIFTDTVVAPYLFAALGAGYWLCYIITKKIKSAVKQQKR